MLCAAPVRPDNQPKLSEIMLTIETKKVFVYGGQKYETAAACLKAIIQVNKTSDDDTFTGALIQAIEELRTEFTGCAQPAEQPVAEVKKRTRKPKAVVEAGDQETVKVSLPVAEPAEVKRRGRPAKSAEPVAEVAAVKRRGRPAKTIEPVAEVKRRGRPAKAPVTLADLPPVPPPMYPGLPPLPPGV